MRALITGKDGQVGTHLVKLLSTQEDVILLALNSHELDITNESLVKKHIADFKPDIIFNAAAYTAVDKAESDIELAYQVNAKGPQYLAEAATHIGAAILHISTDYVFNGDKDGAYTECDLTEPQGVYGQSKLAGEAAVAKACDRHILLRTAWVFDENGNNFVKTMLRLGATRDALSIVGDQFGGPTYAGDIAIALIKIAKRITQGDVVEYGVYHYSGLPHVSWHEFAEVIFNMTVEQNIIAKKPSLTSITTDQYPTPAKRPHNSRLSTDKITDAFSVEASDWKAALNNIQSYTG
ncbi:dTDP-4-dehydrorhamnose reductase [Shewanella surugensis]|uniref:dTDP-4-dehydrorhamnose reductase n=1 Tax=Shewanella surugensis TaxID=212020 RepID=A0ABT0L9R0_9GAMM|nr:dTDP-4-dehydrorhamnose reductase [Shewanella surugensis]MCL1123891.1 dTDP-4-dehydrorhamnose reductase [Shewanella surugensis]